MTGDVKVLVVSLSDAHERRERFRTRAAAATVPWEFFDAHRQLSPDLRYNASDAVFHYGRELQRGELGCYSSHASIWRLLLDDTVSRYVVLEDDVIVDWNMLNVMCAKIAADHPSYIRLYAKKPSRFEVLERNFLANGYTLLRLLDKSWGTQGYVIGKDAAARLLAVAKDVRRPIDDCMDRFWEHDVQNCAIYPHPIIEELATSTIAGRAKPSKGGFKRRLSTWLDYQSRRIYMLKYKYAGGRVRVG